jgi:UDP-glucose 4,6-dehydratase
LFEYVRIIRPEFIINAAGYAGNPNVDACEAARLETLQANALLPQTIGRVCLMTCTPWAHVSSGCIYSGAKVFAEGRFHVEPDLNRPAVRARFEADPSEFLGFTEADRPNFSFRDPAYNFYSGTKVLAEEALREQGQTYLWRPGLPFNERDEPRNLLSKLQRYARVYDYISPLSHAEDFVRACVDLWERRAPFGIYNLTNPGAVTMREVVEMIQRILKPSRRFEFWENDEEFYSNGATALRASCILDVSKVRCAGVKLRPVEEALEKSLRKWESAEPIQTESRPVFEPVLMPALSR